MVSMNKKIVSINKDQFHFDTKYIFPVGTIVNIPEGINSSGVAIIGHYFDETGEVNIIWHDQQVNPNCERLKSAEIRGLNLDWRLNIGENILEFIPRDYMEHQVVDYFYGEIVNYNIVDRTYTVSWQQPNIMRISQSELKPEELQTSYYYRDDFIHMSQLYPQESEVVIPRSGGPNIMATVKHYNPLSQKFIVEWPEEKGVGHKTVSKDIIIQLNPRMIG
jgi:hypothetical protein